MIKNDAYFYTDGLYLSFDLELLLNVSVSGNAKNNTNYVLNSCHASDVPQ